MRCLSYIGYPNNIDYAFSTLVTTIDGKPCLEQGRAPINIGESRLTPLAITGLDR